MFLNVALGLLFVCLMPASANAQGFLNKIKQKANEAAEKKADEWLNGKKRDQTSTSSTSDNANSPGSAPSGSNMGSASGSVRNTTGAGLITSPPNVNENLSLAETSFKASNYGEARSALQQAILGVEMEIGQELLLSLPEAVAGLPKQAEKDQLSSTGWAGTGLSIHREYLKDDKQLSLTIANNSVMMQAINLYLSNSGFAQTTGGEQKWKQTRLKGHKAVIEYDQNSGYKLTLPLGQSTLLVYEAINFSTEQDVMDAAAQFDIDKIKKTLGEQ